MEWSIQLFFLGEQPKEEMASTSAFRFECTKIQGIGVDIMYHIGYFISDFCIWVCDAII